MHPRSLGLRGGGASPQRCYVGVRLVLSAHNHVVVGWPTTSFGTLKLLPTKGGTAVGRAQGDTRGVAKCVGKSREENANKHRGCLLLAKGETTMGRASVVARGRDANKHRGCLLPTMGGTAMGRAKNGHRGCSLTTMGGTAVGRRPPLLLLHTLQSVGLHRQLGQRCRCRCRCCRSDEPGQRGRRSPSPTDAQRMAQSGRRRRRRCRCRCCRNTELGRRGRRSPPPTDAWRTARSGQSGHRAAAEPEPGRDEPPPS